ncbi:putative magnesium transporter [Lachnellula hyalina]|uniref:Putative magnesium transporter n=1 Tax=Lachnellula hyalina TaxID=1316788 RepID=A0A8H8R5V5_9HELO|nr:putative magnesium transporter [Lachnellula hyalina]TVY29162.1 putative magnesium transporter [Lachnellula hyalina]
MLEDKYVDRCLVCVKWDELVLINAWQIHRIGIGHHEYDCDRNKFCYYEEGTHTIYEIKGWYKGNADENRVSYKQKSAMALKEMASHTSKAPYVIIGEIANFAAYAFAPAILVTPLGALSVLIGAVLGSYFLHEELGILGKLGCAICLIGSVIIVLHAPPDQPIETIDEILHYAIQPAVAVFAVVMIYRVAPKYGKQNPLIYLSICSTVGSVSVMSVKAFGIAVKLTLAGKNQFTHPSTYVFIILTTVCILTQMNYFNKALSQFPTSIVNPLYYVCFTTATLCASFILYGGFNTSDAVNTLSLLSGFLVIFTGVYLLNLSRGDPNGSRMIHGTTHDGIATDIISGIQTRRSMQARRSADPAFIGDREGLIHAYDEENGLGLTDLEGSDEEEGAGLNGNGKLYTNGNGNNGSKHSFGDRRSRSGHSSRRGSPLQR